MAYGRVLRTIESVGPAKLHADEQAMLREAADELLFCEDATCAEPALAVARELLRGLVESGRWAGERADQLLADLGACGPLASVA